MLITDHYVNRQARLLMELHGEDAVPKARERAAHLQERGDATGADLWLRIIAAIEELRRTALT